MNNDVLRKSYELVFLMFICITILLYVRSINSNVDGKITLSLQLSALVTSIAAMHYYYMISSPNSPVAYRYFDWFLQHQYY